EEVRKALCNTERARSDELMRRLAPVETQIESLRKTAPTVEAGPKAVPRPRIVGTYDVGPTAVTRLLRRGDHLDPRREVQPGFVTLLTDRQDAQLLAPPAPGAKSSGRRTALARWLTRPDHPLTARVIVNRVWQHHFGEGIVATPDNFGHSGAR